MLTSAAPGNTAARGLASSQYRVSIFTALGRVPENVILQQRTKMREVPGCECWTFVLQESTPAEDRQTLLQVQHDLTIHQRSTSVLCTVALPPDRCSV